MVARYRTSAPWRCAATMLSVAIVLLCAGSPLTSPALGQTEVSSGHRLTDEMRAKLLKPGNLTLRDASFAELMFAIRRVWGVNVVVGNDLKEEKVSCDFADTPLHEILDTILTPRGYAYRPVGNSLAVVKQEALGAMKPLFQTATIPVLFADPKEIKEAASFYLSEKGQIQVVDSARRLVVIDYPERLEQIVAKVKELDEAAKGLGYRERSAISAAEQQAIENGTNSAIGGGTMPLPAFDHRAAFFDLKHTTAEAMAPAIQPLLSTLGKVSTLPKDNRLVVFDTPQKLVLIAQAVRELDIPRPQVRISALIYDAALEDIRRLGVNWNGTGFHGHNLNGSGVAQDSALFDAVTAVAPAAGAANGALTLTSLGSSVDLQAIVHALAESKKSTLLGDPNVTVYDQETAEIDIVTEIPFQQLTQSSQGGNIGTTAFREAGVSLTVTPRISGDDTITMIVNPRFSVLTGFTPGTNQPIIDRRETNTTVRVRNRETLVIGGLRQKNSINNRAGIPGLMSLHWPIGELFKNKDVAARDGELVVFITPEVLDLCYLGQAREHDIYNASLPVLDCIEAPRLPYDACPLEDWKHRCGCKHCKTGGHDGPCRAVMRDAPPPTTVYETPSVPREPLPPATEIEPRESIIPQLPPVQIEESTGHFPPNPTGPWNPSPRGRESGISRETPSPRLTPARVDSASKSPNTAAPLAVRPEMAQDDNNLPAADQRGAPFVKSRPTNLPIRPNAGSTAAIRRLPAIDREEPTQVPAAQTARRFAPRDIFQPLPPVNETQLR